MASSLEELAAFAARLAEAARAETLPRFRAGAAVESKSDAGFDPVTEADRQAERALRRLIEAAYPDHGVLGEEFGAERTDAEWRWVLDPVDGTRAFVCGVASWATLIGLERNRRAVLGVIDQPFTDECWTGYDGRTVYRRGGHERVCRTSDCASLAEARLSTTDPRCEVYFTEAESAVFTEVASRARVMRFSLDAYAYALLATGELDLVIESGLKRHDVVALVPVIEGAGGVVTDWRGGPADGEGRGRIVAAATPALHKAALELLVEA